MNKIHLLYGFLIGISAVLIGACIFIWLFTPYGLSEGIAVTRASGQLGNVLKLGAILNLGVFFGLLKYNKDQMAYGIIIAIGFLAIITFFI